VVSELRRVWAGRRRIPLPRLRLMSSERRLLLVGIDIVVVNLALLLILALRFPYRFSLSTVAQVPLYFVLITIIWCVWASFFDCYDLSRSADASQSAWSAARAALAAALTYLLIPYITPPLLASRSTAALFAGAVVAFVPAWRAVYATLFSQPTFQRRLLIVGAGLSGAEMARELAGTPVFGNPYAGSGLEVVGFVDDDPARVGSEVAGLPVLGDRSALLRLARDLHIDTVVVAITHRTTIHHELFEALLDCREQGVRVEPMTGLYERFTGKVPVAHAGYDLQVALPVSDSPMVRVYASVKRVADFFAGVLGLLAVALVAPWVALANAVSSPGPLFYRQARVGMGGRTFRVLKFRSMIPDAEKGNGAVWASANDPRTTPAGRVLRRTRLDELPQFWNVLVGEMSLVGPRPERPEFVQDLARKIPYYRARHAVRPGITGWAQVRYRYGSSEQDAVIKLQYDLYYIKHQSLYLELSILVKTARVMLGMRGR